MLVPEGHGFRACPERSRTGPAKCSKIIGAIGPRGTLLARGPLLPTRRRHALKRQRRALYQPGAQPQVRNPYPQGLKARPKTPKARFMPASDRTPMYIAPETPKAERAAEKRVICTSSPEGSRGLQAPESPANSKRGFSPGLLSIRGTNSLLHPPNARPKPNRPLDTPRIIKRQEKSTSVPKSGRRRRDPPRQFFLNLTLALRS